MSNRQPVRSAFLAAGGAALLPLLLLPSASLAAQGEAAPAGPAPQTPAAAAAPEQAPAAPATNIELPAPAPESRPPAVHGQRSQPSTPGRRQPAGKPPAAQKGATEGPSTNEAKAGRKPAPLPSALLTPGLPPGLPSSISGVPAFFIESFRIPPFLLPIFQAAGTAYGIPWQVLAAINEVETDYGRDLSVSSAGAEGWMQFLPAEWAQFGVDANGDGFEDPYNPADAIFAAARYLRAAGGGAGIRSAVFSYNHSQAYVESVMMRAQLLGGTPAELLGAVTGLTESRFPVHAAAHFGDGFPAVAVHGSSIPVTVPGTTVYTRAGAPVIAVQDGKVVQIGHSPALGRFIALRDAFGNTYVYAQLGDVSPVYPVLRPHLHSAVSHRLGRTGSTREPAPAGPATAGAQPRSPLSEAGTVSALALGADAALEPAPSAPAPSPAATPPPSASIVHGTPHFFREGPNDVYLHALRPGVQVIAGTVLGHVGAGSRPGSVTSEPHMLFQIRPAGSGAPEIDPKPILDGWVALENTSIFRAKGQNPFLATSPTVGQVLLESKQQLEPQVLHDAGIRLARCGREAVQSGGLDKRVLAMLEYLSVSGLEPTVSGLRCPGSAVSATASNAAGSTGEAISITAINGMPVGGHQRPGQIADSAVRKLLMLQGTTRPSRIVSTMSYGRATGVVADPRAVNAIRVSFSPQGRAITATVPSVLSPSQWMKLIARLGEIPDPTVGRGPSPAAIRDAGAPSQGSSGEHNGNR